MKKLIAGILTAFTLWTIMFSPWTAPHLNFWVCMSISAVLLTILTFVFGGAWWKNLQVPKGQKMTYIVENVLMGIGIAVVLWGIFWLGDYMSRNIFDFARPQVDSIYGMKDGENGLILSLLLLFVIGPAEELFWRNYVQREIQKRWKNKKTAAAWAFVLGVFVYTIVHLFSFNFMLIMAAMVCGLAWGFLFWKWPNRLPAIIISHALWDAAVFIWFPIM